MSDALTTGAERLSKSLYLSRSELIADIAADPGVKALVEACQYVADPCDQDFLTANDKAIAALKLWQHGKTVQP